MDAMTFQFPSARNAWDNVFDEKDNITIEYVTVMAKDSSNGASGTIMRLTHKNKDYNSIASITTVVPSLDVDKKAVQVSYAETGTLVNYSVTIQHNSASAPAYDLVISDIFTPLLSLVPGTLWISNGTLEAGLGANDTKVQFNISRYMPGEVPIRFTYTAMLTQLIPFSGIVTNTASVKYIGTPIEWFNVNQTKVVTSKGTSDVDTPDAVITPQFFGSSLTTPRTSSITNPIAIGETVRIGCSLQFPQGTAYYSTLTVSIPRSARFNITGASVISFPENMYSNLKNGSSAVLRDVEFADGFFDTAVFSFGNITNTPEGVQKGPNDTIWVEIVFVVLEHEANTNNLAPEIKFNWMWNTLKAYEDDNYYLKVTVAAAVLAVSKTIQNTPSTWEAGGIVHYMISVTHAAGSRSAAFDIELFDILTPYLALIPGSVNISSGTIVSGNNTGDTWLYVFPDTLELGVEYRVHYQCLLLNHTNPSSTTINTANVTYYDGPKTTVPFKKYSISTTRSLRLSNADIVFGIYTSSDPGTSDVNNKMTIGEVITIRGNLSVPQGVLPNMVVTFTNPFSVDGRLAIISSHIVSMASNFNSSNGLGTGSNSTLTDTDSDGNFDISTYRFGTVINTPEGQSMGPDDVIVFEYSFLVKMFNRNENRKDHRVWVDLSYSNNNGYSMPSRSFLIEMYIPELEITKVGENSTMFVEAGTLISYTITIKHASTSFTPAYNVTVEDMLSAKFTLQHVTVRSTSGNITMGKTAGDSGVIVIPDTIPPGTTVFITYTVLINNDVNSGSTIRDDCSLTYHSTLNNNPYNVDNIWSDKISGTYTLRIPAPVLSFVVNSSTIPETLNTEVAVGEVMSWYITLDLPQGTTANATLSVFVHGYTEDSYFEILSSAVISMATNIKSSAGVVVWSAGTPIDSNGDNKADYVQYYFGNIVNEPEGVKQGYTDKIIVEVVTMVTKNGTVDSTTYTNRAMFNYTEGGATITTPLRLVVVEPTLKVVKTSNNPSEYLEAGLSIEYVIVVSHASNSTGPAFNVLVSDLLVPELRLQSGTVHTSSGEIVSGNSGNDRLVQIHIPVIPLGGSVNITYAFSFTWCMKLCVY